jgi:hypothetical protein
MNEYIAGEVEFKLPSEAPPPAGVKCVLLTIGGVAVIGVWGYGCVAWSPLPPIPDHIKAILSAKYNDIGRSAEGTD